MSKIKKPAPKGGKKNAAPKKVAKKAAKKRAPRDTVPASCLVGVAPRIPLHPTVEEQWDALRPVEQRTVIPAPSTTKPAKRGWFARFRSAITGLFVSKQYAEANPDTTVREKAD